MVQVQSLVKAFQLDGREFIRRMAGSGAQPSLKGKIYHSPARWCVVTYRQETRMHDSLMDKWQIMPAYVSMCIQHGDHECRGW